MNNKKLVLEIIIIPLCILYLILMLLKSSLAASIIFVIFTVLAAVWLVPKYIEELYIYKSKSNAFKLIFVISIMALVIISILNIILKIKIIKIVFIALSCLVLLSLLYFGIKNIKDVMKKDKDFAINVLYSFSAFVIFTIMLSTLIIYLKY